MFLDDHRDVAATHLEDLGLARSVLGESATEWTGPRHLAAVPQGLDREDYPVALAAWAIDRTGGRDVAPAEVAAAWRDALVLSNSDRNGLHDLLSIWQQIPDAWADLGVAKQKRLAARPGFSAMLNLLGVDAVDAVEVISARVTELSADELAPEPLLRGASLLEAGFQAGPQFSQIIEMVYDAQLEGRVETAEEALALAREIWPKVDPAG